MLIKIILRGCPEMYILSSVEVTPAACVSVVLFFAKIMFYELFIFTRS